MGKADIREILRKYNLGELTAFSLGNTQYNNPRWIKLETSRGVYFLKEYRENGYVEDSFQFLGYLLDNRYPAVEIFRAKDGSFSVTHIGRRYAILEFIEDCPWEYQINERQAIQIGKYLGKLHMLGINYPYSTAYADYNHFYQLMDNGRKTLSSIPESLKSAVEFMYYNMPKTNFMEGMPRSTCHMEFTKRHLVFRDERLIKVFDWDLVSKDYMLGDLGTAMTAGLQDGLNYKILAGLLRGYNEERPLTGLERQHLYGAIAFGVFKNAIWGLFGFYPNFDGLPIEHLKEFTKYPKNEFDNALARELRF